MTSSHAEGHDLTCKELVERVTAYLDEALDVEERARFEAHLAECAPCCEHVNQILVTRSATRRLGAEGLDLAARAAVMDLYHRWRGDRDA
jgi:anti-sigma factor RsiW